MTTISPKMAFPATTERRKACRDSGAEVSCCSDSAPITLAVCGDPVVGRALALLLRGSGYDTRFLPASSLSEPGSLEGIGLLLLAPTPELRVEQREVLLASLRDAL